MCFLERELGFQVLARGDQDVRESAPGLTGVVDCVRVPHDLDGFAGNTDVAAVVYEAADRLPAPKPPAPPPQPKHDDAPMFPFGPQPSNLTA